MTPGLDRVFLWQIAGWDVYLSWVLVGVTGAAVMTMLNIRGVRIAAIVQSTVVIVILLVGGLFLFGSFFRGQVTNLDPLFIDGPVGITLVLVMVPFMFVGFDTIPQAAEEIDLPFRDIGAVLMLSVMMAIAWYCLIVLGVSLMVNENELGSSDVLAAEANSKIYGEFGRLAMLGAGLAGIITSWNAFIVGGSRAIYALARADLLPPALGKLHPRYRTPYNAILLIGGLSVIGPFFGRPVMVWLLGWLGCVSFVCRAGILVSARQPFSVAVATGMGNYNFLDNTRRAFLFSGN